MATKREDSYSFIIPFEYIETNYGNDKYDIAEADMEVELEWDDAQDGYVVSYHCPDEYLIDEDEGNSDIDEFYKETVYPVLMDELEDEGIEAIDLVGAGLP